MAEKTSISDSSSLYEEEKDSFFPPIETPEIKTVVKKPKSKSKQKQK